MFGVDLLSKCVTFECFSQCFSTIRNIPRSPSSLYPKAKALRTIVGRTDRRTHALLELRNRQNTIYGLELAVFIWIVVVFRSFFLDLLEMILIEWERHQFVRERIPYKLGKKWRKISLKVNKNWLDRIRRNWNQKNLKSWSRNMKKLALFSFAQNEEIN